MLYQQHKYIVMWSLPLIAEVCWDILHGYIHCHDLGVGVSYWVRIRWGRRNPRPCWKNCSSWANLDLKLRLNLLSHEASNGWIRAGGVFGSIQGTDTIMGQRFVPRHVSSYQVVEQKKQQIKSVNPEKKGKS